MNLVYIDVTQFLRNPVRTGIQRLVREILANWPSVYPKQVIYLDQGRNQFACVPDLVIEYLIESSNNPYLSEVGVADTIAVLLLNIERTYPEIKPGDTILCPEIFVDQHRSNLYSELVRSGVSLAMVVIDFIPWLDPNAFNIVTTGGLNWYIESVTIATKRCFISAKIKKDFEERLFRRSVPRDPVIYLGANGLHCMNVVVKEENTRSAIVCFGSLDGRKGQDVVFEAFLRSSASRSLKLVFAGRVPKVPSVKLRPLLDYKGPNVEVISDPDDNTLAIMITQARATVYASRQEGFGLPAVESLWLGTPVMLDHSLPAIEELPALGQLRLEPADLENLIMGFDRLANDEEASRLRTEALLINLPTWSDYGKAIATWAST